MATVITFWEVYEEHKMGDTILCRTTKEKDLGVTFTADMKVLEQ